MVGSTSLLGVVGGVADLPEGLASLGNLGLVGGKSVPESGQDLGVHLGVVTGSAAKTNKKKTMNFNLEKKKRVAEIVFALLQLPIRQVVWHCSKPNNDEAFVTPLRRTQTT